MQEGGNNQNENWMPLESNPEVINTFIEKMGLRTQNFCFQEMLSTEEWALEMIPKPCLGIIFLYEQTPVQKNYKVQQQPTLKPEEVSQDVFFMKQYAQNACGTIALFHIVINASQQIPNLIVQNSYLDKFKNQTSNKPPQQKGQFFKQNKDILSEHKSASSQGQSEAVESCESHFIAFVPKNGHIYQLDGFKKCPVDHGVCNEQNFLQKGSELIQQFMQRDPDNINFSMLVLASKPQE